MINSESINKIVRENQMSMLYFEGSTCGACDAIKVKIEKILKKYPKLVFKEINGVVNKEIATEYSVYSLPLMILFADGREVMRLGRNMSISDLDSSIERYYTLLEL